MAEKKELYYPYENTDEFILADIIGFYQESVDEYNNRVKKTELSDRDISAAVVNLKGYASGFGKDTPLDFEQSIVLLEVALRKRNIYGWEWEPGVHIAFVNNQIEICRELMYAKGNSRVVSDRKEFRVIKKEDKDQNVADILGMIMDELAADGLTEDDYDTLMQDFAKILVEWRELDVPKIRKKKAYELLHELLARCFEHKAYHTIMMLSGLLYVADQSEKMDRLPETLYLVGKAMYELGYMEVAKRCLAFADEDTNGECWQDGDDKYKAILKWEITLEVPKEIVEEQRKIDEDVASGKFKLYTEEELDAYDEGELEIPVIKREERVKNRKELGEKALKICEETINGSSKERMQAIEKAFTVFTEAPEIYPEAEYLYRQKAEIFAQSGEPAKALEEYRKAYLCEKGNRDVLVLSGIANVLTQLGHEKEAITYLFRAYIICGKDFVVEHAGEERWKQVEEYLHTTKKNEKEEKQSACEADNSTAVPSKGKKQLFYADDNGTFLPANQSEVMQGFVDIFNDPAPNRRWTENLLELLYYASKGMHPNEFAQAVGILIVSHQDSHYYTSWQEFAHIAWDYNDLEICREFVLRFIKEQSRNRAKESKKAFIPLSEENENQNIADILGIIMEDLQAQNRLDEETCKQILADFVKPLNRWRNMPIPKYLAEDAYEVTYELVEKCFLHKTYKAALRLSGLLFVTDVSRTSYFAHLDRTNWLLGQLMYELGHMATAKECFVRADERSKGACWEGADSKYKELLGQNVKMELTEEVHQKQQELNRKFENGEYTLYTANQLRKHRLGQEKITFLDYKKLEKDRKKLGEKAIKVYEKATAKKTEEHLKAIEAAFAVFTEASETYEAAAYLYCQKANIYMEAGDLETAHAIINNAYQCKDGKRNGMVLLCTAKLLSQMGRVQEATAYLFRAYILCGKDFILDKAGEEPWEMLKQCLAKSRGKCR